MAAHLLSAGHELIVSNRSKAKAEELLSSGAVWAASPGEAASEVDFVITIVGYPVDVETVYLGPRGIVESARKGTILIDMTTSSPSLAQRIAKAAEARAVYALDAPVSGGDVGAQKGTLSIMVGGDPGAFEKAIPLFEKMGKTIVLQGEAGAGQHCKLCNQIAIASNIMGVVEALIYGAGAGLAPRTMLKSIESGAAGSWSLSNYTPRMLDGNVSPGFYVKHFIKDMGLALESSKVLGLKLPGLEKADSLYKALAKMNREELEKASILAQKAAKDAAFSAALFNSEVTNGAELGTQALYLLYAAGRL
ncbi:NAD(P)-dependent oxidoreductase [Treponema sp.]